MDIQKPPGESTQLRIGDLIDTPYGPGVVIEVLNTKYKVTVSGTEYTIKSVGVHAIGRIELPE